MDRPEFGLIIVGDEILSGRRQDMHMQHVLKTLRAHQIGLAWVQYIPDDPFTIIRTLTQSFAQPKPVWVTGGIGATPDDHTRQSAAKAANVPLEPHTEAVALLAQVIAEKKDQTGNPILPESALYQQMMQMAYFPRGARIIPNPYNGVAGFSIFKHHFFPGFPEMAWPMMEWILMNEYQNTEQSIDYIEKSLIIDMVPESQITPMLHQLETHHMVKIFCLPHLGLQNLPPPRNRPHLELGVKGPVASVESAFIELLNEIQAYHPIIL